MKTITFAAYIQLAYQQKLYLMRSWRISMVTELLEPATQDYYLRPIDNKVGFMVGDEVTIVDKITPVGAPIIYAQAIKMKAGDYPNVDKDMVTTYGRWLINCIGFMDELNDVIPYINKEISGKVLTKAYVEAKKAKRLTEAQPMVNSISMLELLSADAELIVPAASKTTFNHHPDLKRLRKEGLDKLRKAGKLNDPVAQAELDTKLGNLDREYVKGTDAENFFISGKLHDVVRKKQYSMYGSETDMEGNPTPLIETSLEEGLPMDRMDDWVNVSRAGSHGRGALTALGGADVKGDYRSLSNLKVVSGDCKTTKGLQVSIEDDTYDMFENLRQLGTNKVLELDFLKGQVGKVLSIRVPGYCKKIAGSYCEYCMGEVAKLKPLAIATEATTIDMASMNAQMQQAHGKAMKAVKFSFDLNCS